MFTILSLKKLLLRPTETIVCVLAFGLGMASLAICWTLLDYSFQQTKILENSLLARSYVVKSAKSDFYAMFASGYVKAGLNIKKEKQFSYSDLKFFQKQLQSLGSVFFSEERVTAPNSDDGAAPASIYEVSSDYFDGVKAQLTLGRKITEQEFVQSAPVLLVSDTFAKSKFGIRDPIGQKLLFAFALGGAVRRVTLTIIGVFHNVGCQVEFVPSCSTNDVGVAPFGVFASTAQSMVVVSPLGFSGGVLDILKHYVESQNAGLSVMNFGVQLKRAREQSNSRAVISLLFAFGGLVAAALTMGNLMYGWVDSRKRLIGVGKALGAKRSQIVLDYLIPASVITVVGAVLGVGLTFVFLLSIHSWVGATLPLEFPTLGLVFCFLITSSTALVAASVPTFLAASVPPAEAFRA